LNSIERNVATIFLSPGCNNISANHAFLSVMEYEWTKSRMDRTGFFVIQIIQHQPNKSHEKASGF